jgi:hypothetical protein
VLPLVVAACCCCLSTAADCVALVLPVGAQAAAAGALLVLAQHANAAEHEPAEDEPAEDELAEDEPAEDEPAHASDSDSEPDQQIDSAHQLFNADRRVQYHKRCSHQARAALKEAQAEIERLKQAAFKVTYPPVRQWSAQRKLRYVRGLQQTNVSHEQSAYNQAEQLLQTLGAVDLESVVKATTSRRWELIVRDLDLRALAAQLQQLPHLNISTDTSKRAGQSHLQLFAHYWDEKEDRCVPTPRAGTALCSCMPADRLTAASRSFWFCAGRRPFSSPTCPAQLRQHRRWLSASLSSSRAISAWTQPPSPHSPWITAA